MSSVGPGIICGKKATIIILHISADLYFLNFFKIRSFEHISLSHIKYLNTFANQLSSWAICLISPTASLKVRIFRF